MKRIIKLSITLTTLVLISALIGIGTWNNLDTNHRLQPGQKLVVKRPNEARHGAL